MSDDSSSSINFPDVPKVELDQLIDQLVERAQGVKHAQGRLRELVRAIGSVSGELTLDSVLRNVVEAGRTLAGARYGLLGVVAADGPEQFVDAGTDGELVARLDRLRADPRETGSLDNDAPEESLLTVPIRIGGELFGNLYLADSLRGRFSHEDEELVVALAAAAATAIGNAHLYQEARLQQQWLRASVDIGAQLLASTGEDPLQMIARQGLEIASADMVALSLVNPARDRLMVEHAVGVGADRLVGTSFPVEATIAGEVVRTGRPLLDAAFEGTAAVSPLIDLGPVMIVPLTGGGAVRGTLSLVRQRGRAGFTPAEVEMAAGFAAHASVALELADSRAAEQKVILLEDRDRIARDLHDQVIQELFAIGTSLGGVAEQVRPDLSQRVRQRVTDLDHTIRRIRSSIFALSTPHDQDGDGLRRRVLEIADDVTPLLGFTPHITFGGSLDLAVPRGVGEDVEAVVRELLTNTGKHAGARRVDLDLSVAGDRVSILVDDDGRGFGATDRSSGLSNLRARAERRGGSFELGPSPRGGARVRWTAPTGDPDR